MASTLMQCVGVDRMRRRVTFKNTKGSSRLEGMPTEIFALGKWYEIGYEEVAAPADAPDILGEVTDGAKPAAAVRGSVP